MNDLTQAQDFQDTVEQINQIPAVKKILEVICTTTGMGFATVARVTKDRWIACAINDQINFGLGVGGELKVGTTLCQQVMDDRKEVVIDHVAEDPIYSNHPTPRMYGLQSYISIPIFLTNGDFFGTLCAIDPNPALLNNDKTISMFKLFAELISFHLESLQNLNETQAKLLEEQSNAEIREQFIAILGHDLRNPVGAISSAAQLMFRTSLDDKNLKLAKIIHDSTIRVSRLIDNILDFASGRLGGGIALNFDNDKSLEETLQQVITELRTVYPEREISADLNLAYPIKGDYKRIAQLFSNLLGNAITHGSKDTPIIVKAKSESDFFELCVINRGNKISQETEKHLFKPFSRGKVHQGKEGLGLGLYIASEIANAHQGKILVTSTDQETCFTFQLNQNLSENL
ncbi:Bacteriophytochrome [Chryseobacterium aquaeductus]|uniref:histidine kinase n=1 Tax=Chryseobacterium aquaeductus TaxID=2675056 RepID=A0A9N8MDF0_9FLAO|nr:GAF domain-containing sensor histidine kinase [Chryseobacterium aquaeductus]CAA7329510.1 Bacteriophytochrome [Chryseobacterium potabilaquae]CAD7797320.1 Bacteriophytochrome [Chryseobacterium aquaeductus]